MNLCDPCQELLDSGVSPSDQPELFCERDLNRMAEADHDYRYDTGLW